MRSQTQGSVSRLNGTAEPFAAGMSDEEELRRIGNVDGVGDEVLINYGDDSDLLGLGTNPAAL